MKQAVFFFTVFATMAAMTTTGEATVPQPAQTQAYLVPINQENLQQQVAVPGPLLAYGGTVADFRQSLIASTQRVVFVPAGGVSPAQSVREESPRSSSLDLLLMITVLVGFIGVQLRRAQDRLQRPFASP